MTDYMMSDEDARAFLRSPARPGVLATTRADGRPHAVPVWYDVDDDGTIVVTTGADTVKGRNLRRDGRASLTVQDEPSFSFVTVEGTVEISEAPGELRRWATRIGGRYMGADRAEALGARNGVPGELLVRLRPSNVVAMHDLAD